MYVNILTTSVLKVTRKPAQLVISIKSKHLVRHQQCFREVVKRRYITDDQTQIKLKIYPRIHSKIHMQPKSRTTGVRETQEPVAAALYTIMAEGAQGNIND